MVAQIAEKPTSRPFTIGPETGDRTLRYWVAGTADELEVQALVEATIPAFYVGLQFQNYSVEPVEDGYSWDVEVKYGTAPRKEPGQWSVSFDISGATAHITYSKENVDNVAPEGVVAPDFKGAINVTDEEVEGCDIEVGAMSYQETHIVAASYITAAYTGIVMSMVGRTNNAIFRDFAVGVMKFKGLSGSKRSGDDWELTFKWDVGRDEIDLPIGNSGIIVPLKRAWEYVWCRFKKIKNANTLIKQPSSAHVERVYDSGDFSSMFPWIIP
jgi:hypothetical protein